MRHRPGKKVTGDTPPPVHQLNTKRTIGFFQISSKRHSTFIPVNNIAVLLITNAKKHKRLQRKNTGFGLSKMGLA